MIKKLLIILIVVSIIGYLLKDIDLYNFTFMIQAILIGMISYYISFSIKISKFFQWILFPIIFIFLLVIFIFSLFPIMSGKSLTSFLGDDPISFIKHIFGY
jgi:hypothetical protein